MKQRYDDINPEDIFLDSANLPGFKDHAFEGRIERPIGEKTFLFWKAIILVLVLLLVSRLGFLQIGKGNAYAKISEENRLVHSLIFANRGTILDRNGVELAANNIKTEENVFASRSYAPISGLSHLIGYIKYPKADKNGIFYEETYSARDGVEKSYDDVLAGRNGVKLVETDVRGLVTSESVVEKPKDGESLTLSIDSGINEELYKGIEALSKSSGFVGGAGVIINVVTGEVLALTSYPQYDQNKITEGLTQDEFNALVNDPAKLFLNRAVGGLYTPGSIIKPILALGALREHIITPEKEILSTGSISVPNPYDASKPSTFKDWKAHGYTAMREALAVSSDTYFYSIGGGYGSQKGLGIGLIDRYLNLFGITELSGIKLSGEVEGVIPTPEWKARHFEGDIWRLGDTYITAIGQYGTQITPLSAARFAAAVANKGKLIHPTLLLGEEGKIDKVIEADPSEWQVVHEGMRESVTYGTSAGLNVPYVEVAAKTGTAEVGAGKKYVHSWSVGFFPYKNPTYAWAVVMEKGPVTNTVGATSVMRRLFDWMYWNRQVYMVE
ncbi:MAG TPA: penicillin-binding transpeptidase domain-containing protein [Candidatus Paceibacterota bacterium]